MEKLSQFLFSLILVALLVNAGWGQQVIGSFPSQDGGFEGQTIGSLSSTSSTTSWWLSSSITGSIVNTSPRTGNKYANINMTGDIDRTLRGPAIETFLTATSYIVQFYYKGDKNNDGTADYGDIRGGINGSTYQYGGYTQNINTGSSWTKYYASVTPGASTSTGHAVVSIIEIASKFCDVDIDDVVLYQGFYDFTPPLPPGSVTVSSSANNSMDISWGAASGGVDGGGYVVVRYAVNPNANNDPNQNGIYALNNIITNGTGSLEGTVRYIGTGTNFTDDVGIVEGIRYYYKVYTVDKAFNYSAEASGNNVPLPVTLLSFSSSVEFRDVILRWTTEIEENNSGFEVQRTEVGSQKSEFSKIGYVQGKGTVNTPTNYSFEDKNLQTGKYKYRLKQLDYNGNYEYFELNGEVEVGVPKKYDISQNYPNPFNPVTKINFDLPENGRVDIRLYDMLGREVAVLVNEVRNAGYYTVQFDASKLSSGIYFYKMNAGKFSGIKKMSLIK